MSSKPKKIKRADQCLGHHRGLKPREDNNRNTVHVVANAIYFKGEWRDPFDKEDTVDREFHRLDGSSVEVPFLQSSVEVPLPGRELWYSLAS